MKKYHGKIKRMGRVADILKNGMTDPDGSYTGVVTDEGYSVPVQDADDL